MAKKKLLIIHRALAPYRIEFFNRLCREFDATIYFEFDNPLEQSFDREQLQRRIQFDYQVLEPPTAGIKNLRLQLFGLVALHRPDIILSSEFNLITPTLLIAKAIHAPKARLIVMCDDNEMMAASELRYGRGLKSLMLGRVEGVVLCDSRALRLYASRPRSTDRFCYFPILQEDAVLREQFAAALSEGDELRHKYVPEGQPLFLYVGRLAEEKNLPALLKAFQNVSDRAQLLIVGAGSLELKLRQLADSLGLSHAVHWAGKQEGNSLYAHYNAADALILPSTLERFGSVVNEALLAGVPVLCSQVAAASELINPSNGYVFDPFEPEVLESALHLMMQRFQLGHYTCQELRPSLMPFSFDEAIRPLLNFLDR